jgi:hypothetical protein
MVCCFGVKKEDTSTLESFKHLKMPVFLTLNEYAFKALCTYSSHTTYIPSTHVAAEL